MKRYAAIFLCIPLMLSLFACGNEGAPTCLEILETMTSCEVGLPAGETFFLQAEEGEEGYLSASLLSALYGNGALPEVSRDWVDAAIFLPAKQVACELAVILCSSRSAAEDTAELFCSRLSVLRSGKDDTQSRENLEGALAVQIGNYALMILSSDAPTALKRAQRLIGQDIRADLYE